MSGSVASDDAVRKFLGLITKKLWVVVLVDKQQIRRSVSLVRVGSLAGLSDCTEFCFGISLTVCFGI